eukprot:5435850-Amphidinium_carterae.1
MDSRVFRFQGLLFLDKYSVEVCCLLQLTEGSTWCSGSSKPLKNRYKTIQSSTKRNSSTTLAKQLPGNFCCPKALDQ